MEEAGQLADDYIHGRKWGGDGGKLEATKEGEKKQSTPKRCGYCSRTGHWAKECRAMAKSTTQEECGKAEQSLGKEPRCFNCHQLGHIAVKCPSSTAMFCCGSDRRKQPVGGGGWVYQSKCPGISRAGTVEDTAISDIMLDTGVTQTLVRRDLVPKEKIGVVRYPSVVQIEILLSIPLQKSR